MNDPRAALAAGYDAMIDVRECRGARSEDDVRDHVRRQVLGASFARIHAWLRRGGLVLTTLGAPATFHWVRARG